jgi:hypothetical protein
LLDRGVIGGTALQRRDTLASRMTDGGARIDGAYRYSLWRRVGRSPRRVLFVMLNPSTADAKDDDPTIRRCIGFARAWGYGELEVCNLFAYRTPHPRVLLAARDPVGPENDAWLARAAGRASRVVAAWGVVGMRSARAEVVMEILRGARVVCLGRTRGGAPRHPLYVAGGTRVRRFANGHATNGQKRERGAPLIPAEVPESLIVSDGPRG